jgi:kynurenine formamidase
MLRLDALAAVYPRLESCVVVTIMGAVVVAAPLTIVQGSGSPVRVLAIAPV